MPTEVSPPVTQTPLLTPVSVKSKRYTVLSPKYCQGKRKMNATKKKLIPALVLVLSGFSILRLLNISIPSATWSPPAVLLQTPSQTCPSSSPYCNRIPVSVSPNILPANDSPPTTKELKFLSNLISRRAPCNILVFGIENQYKKLSSLNAGGMTVFLEDNLETLSTIETNFTNTRVHKVEYQTFAKDAYGLLKHARNKPHCSPKAWQHKEKKCKLALTNLPPEVYNLKWDVIVVDGPRGNRPDMPGRMATIYTASMLARHRNMTNVFVHDVDRMIEKWFSWEFLCDSNLVSSKGKFWNFRIAQQSNSTTFCPT